MLDNRQGQWYRVEVYVSRASRFSLRDKPARGTVDVFYSCKSQINPCPPISMLARGLGKACCVVFHIVWLILQRMRGSKNHAAIALTIRAIRAMRQGNIKSGQCPHPVIRRKHPKGLSAAGNLALQIHDIVDMHRSFHTLLRN